MKMGWIIKATLATVLGGVLMFNTAKAAVAPDWTHFRDRAGNQIIVKSKCLRAEDSAAHLRLILISLPGDGENRWVYGCKRHGF